MAPKKFLAWVLIAAAAIFLIPVPLVLVFDPFFVFHKPYFMEEPLFDGTDRYQNAGLINSWLADPSQNIDTLIIGTSLSQNFDVREYKNSAGVDALKITMAGATPLELKTLAEAAIRTGHVRRIIWEVGNRYTEADRKALHAESPLPVFLYNETKWDDWRYVLNNDVVEDSVKMARGKYKKRKPLQELYSWDEADSFKRFSSKENLKKLSADLDGFDLPIKLEGEGRSEFPNVGENLLPLLKANPQINFDLYFPPISYYGYAAYGSEGFREEMRMRAALLAGVKDLKNVRVYGFDLIDGVGDDITVYQDNSHYKPWVNQMMLKNIRNGKFQITAQGWSRYEERLAARVNNYASAF